MSYRATQADRPVQPHLMNMARLSPPRAPCDKSPVAPNHFIGRLHISQRIENRRDVMRFNKMLVVGTSAVGLCLPTSGVLAQTQQPRSEEHTSELQSLMRISYAVFCLKKKTTRTHHNQ